MDATQIITLSEAKEWLSVTEDTNLDRLIRSSISFVETYTGISIVTELKEYVMDSTEFLIRKDPYEVISAKNQEGVAVPYKIKTICKKVTVLAPTGTILTIQYGYKIKKDIPPMLIEVAYKMLTYMYENRDIYTATLPQDFQIMINKLRRNLF